MTGSSDPCVSDSLFARLKASCAEDWQAYVGHEFVDRLGGAVETSDRWVSLTRTFREATRLEIGFWDMGLAPSP